MISNIKEAKELVKRYKEFKGNSWHELKVQTGIGSISSCTLCRPLRTDLGPKCGNCIWSVDSQERYFDSKHCLNKNYHDLSWVVSPTAFRSILAERVVMLEERIATQSNLFKRLLYAWRHR